MLIGITTLCPLWGPPSWLGCLDKARQDLGRLSWPSWNLLPTSAQPPVWSDPGAPRAPSDSCTFPSFLWSLEMDHQAWRSLCGWMGLLRPAGSWTGLRAGVAPGWCLRVPQEAWPYVLWKPPASSPKQHKEAPHSRPTDTTRGHIWIPKRLICRCPLLAGSLRRQVAQPLSPSPAPPPP